MWFAQSRPAGELADASSSHRVPVPHMAPLIAIAALLLAVGCGGDKAPPPAKPIVVEPPAQPTDADCGLTGEGSAKDAENPPRPGTYTYRLEGEREVAGDRREVTKLPTTMRVIVTEAIRDGAQSCFAMQRRYEEDLGETGVFVINGSDILLRSGRFQAGGDITEITPDPPVLALSGDELEWSGEFAGATSGRYRASISGRKRMKVGNDRVEVVGVETVVSYSGEIVGSERSTRWISVDSGLVIAETVTQRRDYGLDKLKLTYTSRLQSLDPS